MRIPNLAYWAIAKELEDEEFYMGWHEARRLQLDLRKGYIKSRTELTGPAMDSGGEDYFVMVKLIPEDIPTEDNVPFEIGYLYIGRFFIALKLKEIVSGGKYTAPSSKVVSKYWKALNRDELFEIIGIIIKHYERNGFVPKWDVVDFNLANVKLDLQCTKDVLRTGDFREPFTELKKLGIPKRYKFKKDKTYILEIMAKENGEVGRWLVRFYDKKEDNGVYWIATNNDDLLELREDVTVQMSIMGYE